MIKKWFEKWKGKKLSTRISDIIFIVFVILILIPGTRMEIMGFVNRVKAKIIQPSLEKESKVVALSDKDFNWDLVSLEKGRINLNEFKGKVIFINLWATWCPPCVGELPEIQKLYDKFKDNEDIVFLLVSNEQPETIEQFLSKNSYKLPACISLNTAPDKLKTRTIPTSFVINKKGEIVLKERGAVNWGGKKMERIMNQLIEN